MSKRKVPYKHPYYNFDKLFSHNAVFNIVCGGRGIGKSYGMKKRVIDNAIKKDEQFVWIRRYREELTVTMRTFMADIEHNWPDYDFRMEQKQLQFSPVSAREAKPREWKTAGAFVPLSKTQDFKGASFPKVTLIVMDEFIKEESSGSPYLRGEADALTNFYFTVDRGQDRSRLVMLSNAVTIDNPYFISWDIRPDLESEWIVKDKGFIAAHFPDSDLFQKSIYSTRFGRWIKDTAYAEYAVGNVFADNTEELIAEKAPQAKPRWNMETDRGTFTLWFDPLDTGCWYATRRLARLDDRTVTFDSTRMGEGKVVWSYSDERTKMLRRAFRTGRMFFDHPHTRNAFMEIFKR